MWNDIYVARGPLAGFVVEGIAWGSYAALVPALKAQAGMSDAQLGAALLVGALVAFLSMLMSPRLEPVLRIWMMPALALLMALGFVIVGFSGSLSLFVIGMMLAPVGAGALDVAMNARISILETRRGRPLMSMAHGIFSLSYAIAALSAGMLRQVGMSPGVILVVMACTVVACLAPMFTAPVADEETDTDAKVADGLRWRVLMPLGAIVLIAFMAEQASEGWSALHLERSHNASAALGALGPAILGLTMAVGRLFGQAIAARFSEPVILYWASGCAVVGTVMAAWASGLVLGYLGFAVLGLGVSVIAPMAFAWAGKHAPAGKTAVAISRVAVLGYAGFFVGPPMMGFLSQAYGLSVSFSAMALLLCLIPGLLVPLSRRRLARLAV